MKTAGFSRNWGGVFHPLVVNLGEMRVTNGGRTGPSTEGQYQCTNFVRGS